MVNSPKWAQFQIIPAEATDIMKQKQPISTVPCPNYELTESVSMTDWLFFNATKFGVVCYTIIDNHNGIIIPAVQMWKLRLGEIKF